MRIIFKQSLKEGIFLEIWKKGNAVPVHKKEHKNLLKIIVQLAYFPSFSSIWKSNYLQTNKLYTPLQSGFLPGDLWIAELLSIKHEIQTGFDNNPTVDLRGVFLDIWNTFDKV